MRKMNKKILSYLLTSIMLCMMLVISPAAAVHAEDAPGPFEKKACWISFLDMRTLLRDKNEADFRARIAMMYDNIAGYGMNTVIVHVRSMGDAIYPSALYPWSDALFTSRSDPGYDPLQIMIELAHARGLQFEAWINPFRLSSDDKSTASFKATPFYALYQPYVIEYRTSGGQTCLALDPARQETRNLIVGGVIEIVNGYDVDGIHFDDYFYVPGMADGLDLMTKKANVNMLVAQVYQTIKAIRPSCTFGISPAGNPNNARSQGADIDTWLSVPGYVDYIMPQIYWSDVYVTKRGEERMFTDRCSMWAQLNKIDIPLYVGLGLYNAGTGTKSDVGWTMSDANLACQYLTAKQFGYDGYALFRYLWLEKEVSAAELANLRIY